MDSELSRVVDALPGLVWTAPPDGHIDFLNQRWCEYTNLGLGESYGRGWHKVVHPEDLSGLLERLDCSNAGDLFWLLASQVKWKRAYGASTVSTAGSCSALLPWPTHPGIS
jgi:PAS domain-containing protein